jgi:hypothetical protein
MPMESYQGVEIRPSDLFYKYRRKKEHRDIPKFAGKPDPHCFDGEDLYEVIPMLEAVMNELGSVDGRVLNRLEEVMTREMPTFVLAREEVFDFLVGVMRDLLDG